MRVSIFPFFLTLETKFHLFTAKCVLVVGLWYIVFIMLICFPFTQALMSFYHEWMLSFVTYFFCIYCEDMIFIFPFVNMVYHTVWFANIETLLHSWQNFQLIIVCNPFLHFLEFCLLIFCWGSLHLYSSEILAYGFLLLKSLFGFDIRLMEAS